MIASRRSFLIGGASVAAAAIPVAVPAVAALENPVLISIGERLPAAMEEYRAVLASYRAAVEVFDRIKPDVPADLVCTWPDPHWWHGVAEKEKDIDGTDILVAGSDWKVRSIIKAEKLREALPEHTARSKLGKEMRRRLQIAESFEAEYAQALEKSGASLAQEAEGNACRIISDMGEVAGKAEAKTMLGIVIKARAFAAVGEAEGYTKFNHATFVHGNQLLSEINSIMGAV